MDTLPDYYKILELDETANLNDIQKSFRKLSMKYHPDVSNGDSEKYKQITDAYNVLGKKQSKHEYDSMKQKHTIPINPEDLLSSIFGTMAGINNLGGMGNIGLGIKVNPMNKPFGDENIRVFSSSDFPFEFGSLNKSVEPIIYNLDITLEQAYTGCNLPITIKRNVVLNNNTFHEDETIYVKVYEGIDHNEIIIIKNKGNSINNLKGDIKVVIHIKNDTVFKRNGLDLIIQKNISLKEALCGITFELKHLNTKVYNVTNEQGNIITPNYKKYIDNMGFNREGKCGCLIIEFNILFPDKITKPTIEKLQAIL